MSPRTGPGPSLRLAEHMIRGACRGLPDSERADKEMEWSAEAEAAACDTGIRFPPLRALLPLWFAASLLLHARAARGRQRTVPARSAGLLRAVIRRSIRPNALARAAGGVAGTVVALNVLAGAVAAVGAVVGVVVVVLTVGAAVGVARDGRRGAGE